MNGPALIVHAGFTGHSALQLLAGQVVAPAVLDEHGAGLDKAEGHVGIYAFLPERLDPTFSSILALSQRERQSVKITNFPAARQPNLLQAYS